MSNPLPYLTPEWKALRARILQRDPLCVLCRMAPSQHVDHIRAHRGDQRLFWDPHNLRGLCRSCHNAKSVKRDGGWGKAPSDRPLKGTAPDGSPTDPDHAWNRR